MAGFKDLNSLVGRTITNVVIKAGETSPQVQVMLVFDDGRVYELYSSEGKIGGTWLHGAGGLEHARSYLPTNGVIGEHP